MRRIMVGVVALAAAMGIVRPAQAEEKVYTYRLTTADVIYGITGSPDVRSITWTQSFLYDPAILGSTIYAATPASFAINGTPQPSVNSPGRLETASPGLYYEPGYNLFRAGGAGIVMGTDGTPLLSLYRNGFFQFQFGGQSYTAERAVFQLIGVAAAPVPEPASWAMMIIGFGAIGGTLRSRRHLKDCTPRTAEPLAS